jgi:predicted phage terminase large subunit-like protein
MAPQGNIYTRAHFSYTPALQGLPTEWTVISLDTASKSTAQAAYWAAGVYRFTNPRSLIYLDHVRREKHQYAEGKAWVRDLLMECQPNVLLIEDKSTGQALLSELPLDLGTDCPLLVPIRPEGDKYLRASRGASQLKYRNMQVNPEADWWPDFINEVTLFPLSRYADQVDQLSQFLIWLISVDLSALTKQQQTSTGSSLLL